MTGAKITKRTVDAAKPGATRYVIWDSEVSGFGLRVGTSGRKVYLLKYRIGGGRKGTRREPVIGKHGDLTPDQARQIALEWMAEVRRGGDPAQTREALRDAPRMADLLARYLADHAERHKKASSVANDRRLIETRLRPALGKRKVAEVTRAEVERLHNRLAATPYEANRVLALLSKMFNLAEAWEMRPDGSNPCRHVKRFREERRERFLSERELARLGAALAAAERGEVVGSKGAPISPHAIAAIRLLIFTGARRGEVLGLRWDWIAWEAQRAELPDSKSGRKFLYLPPAALEVLRAVPRVEGNPHVIVGGRLGAALVNLTLPWIAIRSAAGLAGVRLHDLRHSFASVGAGAGMSLPLIGALLGHRETATTARYAHLSDDPQRAGAALISDRIKAAMAAGENDGARTVVTLGDRRS